ncbi:hypothetical protein ACQ4M3_19280 [Leptolyngbya sp. AN03gr2]|uniref:hypothetical protein n=1 Tax=Leptolyngbya sp. AN03gr2 TaxID=3423364 RepID=UPI003D312A65
MERQLKKEYVLCLISGQTRTLGDIATRVKNISEIEKWNASNFLNLIRKLEQQGYLTLDSETREVSITEFGRTWVLEFDKRWKQYKEQIWD